MAKENMLMYSTQYHQWVPIEIAERLDDVEAIIEYHDPWTGEDKRMIVDIANQLTAPADAAVGATMQRYKPKLAKARKDCDCCESEKSDFKAKMKKSSAGEYVSVDALDTIAKLQAKLIKAGIEL
jgi:hypothetical protein